MRVLAALSGGVDSAVAAARAVAAGHDVTGVHMALSSSPQSCRVGARGCCSLEDSVDAAQAAATLDIPYYVWDLAEQFEETVITDFIEQYRLGRTPNPCVRCNEFVKFQELANRARALGFDAVCTGHYARVVDGPAGKELHRAKDIEKDQSYVLAVMGEDELQRVVFPLGEVTSKTAVRAEAEERGLGVSNKPDSYDICFIPDGDTQGFLRRHLGDQEGKIVDSDGNVLGTHRGYFEYTVGQRKGLNLTRPAADGRPRYVLETKPHTNTVVVGAAELLSVNQIDTSEVTWLASDDQAQVRTLEPKPLGSEGDECLYVQMRAHGQPIPVAGVERTQDGQMRVQLAQMVRGIAAGQSLVLYRGTRVLAHAVIIGTGTTR
ncbi:MAG: tRNA 2-thiouridine(34) synthase MnmA [Actinomycetaceae bacterium]|nr:tRNA 2-thiouridine(34) synthase MnmA [Actinomycetaceae bacterium]